jgi:[pyruvate, water dikinase]-phosphate phosphotransferase / [pyruvate, water dikinase] kinase
MSREGGTIIVVSDGTGETAATIIRAALVQFSDRQVNLVRCKNVRTQEQVEAIIEEARTRNAAVVYTVVNKSLRDCIQDTCDRGGVPHLDLFGPLLGMLSHYFVADKKQMTPGLLRAVDEKYFRRIDAIEYTVKHDDGKELSGLSKADIILVGISRTSKTPLSVFLSHKGWKVANVPIVLGVPPPKELFEVDQKKVVALTIDLEKLARIRANRLQKLGQDLTSDYASDMHISRELEYANELYSKNRRWPVFDVTEKALEETATEITRLIAARQGKNDDTELF